VIIKIKHAMNYRTLQMNSLILTA